jgi:hypothetical protein
MNFEQINKFKQKRQLCQHNRRKKSRCKECDGASILLYHIYH